MTKASVTISSPSGSPTILVFWCQISSQRFKGFPRAAASNKGWWRVGKFSHFYLRDAMLARVIAILTCLSACLFVTSRYCVKTKKASIMIYSPSGSPKTLVFWRQMSSRHSKGFSPKQGPQTRDGWVKLAVFLSLSVNISTRKLSSGWETRKTRQHSKFIQKKSIEIRNEHSVRLLRLHTAWNSLFSKWVLYSNYKYV